MSADGTTVPLRADVSPARVVVVADDNDEFRSVLAEHLERRGFVVHQAANGLDAILMIRRLRSPAVVLDLLMPRLGGLEALNRIRAFAPTIRVVVVTAVDDREVHRQALRLGAAALFTKPVVIDDLVTVLSGPTTGSDESRPLPGRLPAATTKHGPTGAVLIVDDEPDMRELLRDVLEGEGYATRTAGDGEEAIQLVKAERPPVILLDILMAGLGGIEALTVIRSIAPETRVVMVSAVFDLEIAKRALAYGAFDYVTKPVHVQHLCDVVAAAFVQPWQ